MIWTYIHFVVLHVSYSPNTFAGFHNRWPVNVSKVNLTVNLFHIFAYFHFLRLPWHNFLLKTNVSFHAKISVSDTYKVFIPSLISYVGNVRFLCVALGSFNFFRKAPLQWEPSSQEEFLIKLCLAVLLYAVKSPSDAFRQLTMESFSTSLIIKSSLFSCTLTSHCFILWL